MTVRYCNDNGYKRAPSSQLMLHRRKMQFVHIFMLSLITFEPQCSISSSEYPCLISYKIRCIDVCSELRKLVDMGKELLFASLVVDLRIVSGLRE